MPNFGRIIKGINNKTINRYNNRQNELKDMKLRNSTKSRGRPKYSVKKDCNCEKPENCPLENHCNRVDVTYKAETHSQNLQENGKIYL